MYGDGFHRFLKILAAMEISADVIGLPAHRSSFADGRGKELTILVILASVKGFLYCVHSYLLDFILLSCDRSITFPLLCHSINQKLARDLAPLRKFSYRFPPRPEGVFSGFRKKSLHLIATGIVQIKLLHKDFSTKNNIILSLRMNV